MTSNYNDIVKQGYVRVKGSKVGLFKKRWLVLRKASSTGPCRLEKYADEASAKYGVNRKEITLEEVTEVMRVPDPLKRMAFATIDKHRVPHQFLVESDIDADEWVNSLEKVLRVENFSRGNEPDVVSSGLLKSIYHVCLLPSTKLDFHGECLMQISSESINLLDATDPNKLLVTWPVCSLRRYGKDVGKFTFETGRSCGTGEGMFGVTSKDSHLIYNQVNDNAHALAIQKKEAALKKLPPKKNSKNSSRHLFTSHHSNDAYYYGDGEIVAQPTRPLPPVPPTAPPDD